jgi:GGDEF domain-containing protein
MELHRWRLSVDTQTGGRIDRMSSERRSAPPPAEASGPPTETQLKLAEWSRRSRLLMAVFWPLVIATLLWAIPWLPYGTTLDDYNSRTAVSILLLAVAAALAFAILMLRSRVRQTEQALLTREVVKSTVTGLRSQEALFERLLLECERSEESGRPLAVMVFRLSEALNAGKDENLLHKAVDLVRKAVRETDVVSPVSAQEIAVLALDVAQRDVSLVANRLRRVLSDVGDGKVEIKVGWSNFGPNSPDAGALLAHARAMLHQQKVA